MIVNLARVRELRLDANGEHEAVLEDGTRLIVSRAFREHLQNRLGASVRAGNASR